MYYLKFNWNTDSILERIMKQTELKNQKKEAQIDNMSTE